MLFFAEFSQQRFGHESKPRLEAIDLILSDSTDVEKQWSAMCAAATELQVRRNEDPFFCLTFQARLFTLYQPIESD